MKEVKLASLNTRWNMLVNRDDMCTTHLNEQTGWTWALITLAIPLVKKSHKTMRPSLQPTAKMVPCRLNTHVTAMLTQSKAPSNSWKKQDSVIIKNNNDNLMTSLISQSAARKVNPFLLNNEIKKKFKKSTDTKAGSQSGNVIRKEFPLLKHPNYSSSSTFRYYYIIELLTTTGRLTI